MPLAFIKLFRVEIKIKYDEVFHLKCIEVRIFLGCGGDAEECFNLF